MKSISYRPGDKRFKNDIVKKLRNIIDDNTIIICIGSSRVYGDSVGPKVGTLLTNLNLPIPVFGTETDPIHSINFNDKILQILEKYPSSKIIAIDACCATKKNIGNVLFREGGVEPGKGLNKNLRAIGDYSLLACTVEKDDDESIIMTNLLDYNNDYVDILSSSIVGLIFRSYELGPTIFNKILTKKLPFL